MSPTHPVLFPGYTQSDESGDGAEDESAAGQQAEHAQGSSAHEQAQPSEHTQVSPLPYPLRRGIESGSLLPGETPPIEEENRSAVRAEFAMTPM